MKKYSLWYRSRGLDKMEERFGNNLIQKFINTNKYKTGDTGWWGTRSVFSVR